ncbi:13359_t:CDS:2, partial [Dentiscutata heterogama]
MTHQLRNVYIFDDEYESLVDLSSQPISHSESNNSDNPTISSLSNPLNNDPQTRTYWRPSNELQNLYDRFQNNILKQWPRIACVYCGTLLYPEKASWIIYNPSITYPLQQRKPGVSLSFNPNVNLITDFRVPTSQHSQTNNEIPPVNSHEIIVPNYDFPDEIHNEDFHYTRLMAGFVQE